MIYRLTMIHISIHYGGPFSNANPYDGVSFQGPGIQCYYRMIRHKLKTLNELEVKIMEELKVSPALHDIHITFHFPYEVLNQCINYRYMAITEDKHVKFMMTMKLLPFLMLMIWLNVMKMMRTLMLELSMLQIRPPFMNLLPHQDRKSVV